jgi:hypothetical protein
MSPAKSLFILVFLCFSSLLLRSQTSVADTGKIELVQDYKIKDLVAKHVDVNAKSDLKGYRIKIHFGSDKTKAREIKAKFIAKFPDVPAYEKYDQPNFNIRVGDFRTKLEAYKFLKEIQPEFPAAFIVLDEIEFPKID